VPQRAPAPSVDLGQLGERPEQRVPMSRLRARIAERLVQSQSTAAILTTFNEANMQPIMDLRNRYKDRFEKEHGVRLGFMFLPAYRLWVVAFSLVVCIGTWFAIEHTRLGAYLRAANERPYMVEAFGINVPRMVTLTYGFGVGLAALSGVLAAPIYQVSPSMGSSVLIVVFAVVVIGGMGSIAGAIFSGYALGLVEGLTKVFYPSAANVVIFLFMAVALFLRPAGLFAGREGAR